MTKGLPRKATEEQILKLCETDKGLEKLWFDELKAGEKEKQAYKQYLDALHEVDARALGTLSGPVLRWRRSSADCRLGDRGQARRGANDPSIPPVAPVHLRVETCDAEGSQNACRVRVVFEIDITVFNASVH